MKNNINKEVGIYHGDRFKLIPSNKSLYVIYCQIHVQVQVCITAPEKMNSIIFKIVKSAIMTTFLPDSTEP